MSTFRDEAALLPDAEGVRIIPVTTLPEIAPGESLAPLLCDSLAPLARPGDVAIVTHKIVSKAEGRVVELSSVEPSPLAVEFGSAWSKDPRQVEVVLRESKRVVRMVRGLIIAETRHGFICANAGVDLSNAGATDRAILLPVDPDASARRLHEALSRHLGFSVPVVISDSFGRPWRNGIVNIAIGVAGLSPVLDYRGQHDPHGYLLSASIMATADTLASAAELVMGKVAARPVALVRGYPYQPGPGSAQDLIMDPSRDLFP